MDFFTWMVGEAPYGVRGAWASVLLPLALTLYTLIRYKDARSWAYVTLVLGTFSASACFSGWDITDESVSQHLFPAFMLVLALLAYANVYLPPLVAYTGCFVSLAGADVLGAALHLGDTLTPLQYLQGIGGAGLGDGLVIFPTLCFALQLYVGRRQHEPSSLAEFTRHQWDRFFAWTDTVHEAL